MKNVIVKLKDKNVSIETTMGFNLDDKGSTS